MFRFCIFLPFDLLRHGGSDSAYLLASIAVDIKKFRFCVFPGFDRGGHLEVPNLHVSWLRSPWTLRGVCFLAAFDLSAEFGVIICVDDETNQIYSYPWLTLRECWWFLLWHTEHSCPYLLEERSRPVSSLSAQPTIFSDPLSYTVTDALLCVDCCWLSSNGSTRRMVPSVLGVVCVKSLNFPRIHTKWIAFYARWLTASHLLILFRKDTWWTSHGGHLVNSEMSLTAVFQFTHPTTSHLIAVPRTVSVCIFQSSSLLRMPNLIHWPDRCKIVIFKFLFF